VVTRKRLKELLSYDPDTGLFVRLVTVGNQVAGTIAGSKRKDGYIALSIDGVTYKAHRLAWLYMKGRWPKPECDHADTDRGNNRWSNLRCATKAQNKMNSKKRADSRHKHKGVKLDKGGKYRATIRTEHLGMFETEEAAAAAYELAARERFGEFARA
jgi:hypothetical protein